MSGPQLQSHPFPRTSLRLQLKEVGVVSVPSAANDVAVPADDGRHLLHHAVRRVHQLDLVARLQAEDEVTLFIGIQDIFLLHWWMVNLVDVAICLTKVTN